MSKKQPYLRGDSGWDGRLRWASEKGVGDKKRQTKKALHAGRKRSLIPDHTNLILQAAILQTISLNDHNYHTRYDYTVDKISVNVIFSKSYTLMMNLPSTMRLSQVQVLVGCYVKLHLRYRPTERHVYRGLEGEWQKRSSIMPTQQSQLPHQSDPQQLQEQSPTYHLTPSIVTYLTDSMLLSDSQLLQQAHRSLLQRSSQENRCGTLREMVAGRRLASAGVVGGEGVRLLVRYDDCFTNKSKQSATITPAQNNELFTLDPDQHNEPNKYNPIKTSPQHSLIHTPSHNKQIPFTSPNTQLMKWFTETSIVKWLVVYQHIMGNGNGCGDNSIKEQQQRQQNNSTITIPIQLTHPHNTKPIYHLTIINWHHYQPQQVCQKTQHLTKCLISSDLPLTHCVKEMYFVTKMMGQDDEIGSRNQWRGYRQSDSVCVLVLETLYLRTLGLKEYFRYLVNKLVSGSKGSMDENKCNSVCQCMRIDDPNYLYDTHFYNETQQQTLLLQSQIKTILANVKSLCLRITSLHNNTTNNLKNPSQQIIPLLQLQSILDIFDITINPSPTTQVLINTIAYTSLIICDHDGDKGISSKKTMNKSRDKRRCCDGEAVYDQSLASGMGIQSDEQEEHIGTHIWQRLKQQVLAIANQLHISPLHLQHLATLLTSPMSSLSNTHPIHPTALFSHRHRHRHHPDYLALIITQLSQQSERFLSQLQAPSWRRISADRNQDEVYCTTTEKVLEEKCEAFFERALGRLQQRLTRFREFIHNNRFSIKIDCLYLKPQVNTFLQDQNLDIHEKQTTLKKKNQKLSVQQNSNTPQDHSKRKRMKVISTSGFECNPIRHNKKNTNNKSIGNYNSNTKKYKKPHTKRPTTTTSSTFRK